MHKKNNINFRKKYEIIEKVITLVEMFTMYICKKNKGNEKLIRHNTFIHIDFQQIITINVCMYVVYKSIQL